MFRNRKGYFSLNVQTIASPDLKILNIVARWAGSVHDQTIFRESNICQRFEAGNFGNFILIGDSGYANTRYLATPYSENNREYRLDPRKVAYQNAVISTRNVVERQYGAWKRRFPVLAYGIRLKVQTAMKIITACAILHNICIDARDYNPPQESEENEETELPENVDEGERNEGNVGLRRGETLARDMILNIF